MVERTSKPWEVVVGPVTLEEPSVPALVPGRFWTEVEAAGVGSVALPPSECLVVASKYASGCAEDGVGAEGSSVANVEDISTVDVSEDLVTRLSEFGVPVTFVEVLTGLCGTYDSALGTVPLPPTERRQKNHEPAVVEDSVVVGVASGVDGGRLSVGGTVSLLTVPEVVLRQKASGTHSTNKTRTTVDFGRTSIATRSLSLTSIIPEDVLWFPTKTRSLISKRYVTQREVSILIGRQFG